MCFETFDMRRVQYLLLFRSKTFFVQIWLHHSGCSVAQSCRNNSLGLVKPSNLLGSWLLDSSGFFHRKDPAHLLNLGGFGALLAILPLETPPCHDVLKPRAVCDGGLPKS